jgi:hypothetical protein
VFGGDAANEGFLQNYTVVAGNDYRVRALAYSEDGVGQPEVVVYDNTGAAMIVTMTGTVTSTERVPDVLEACFEAPALCTSIAVKIINTAATGVVGFQKIMLLANLFDDSGFETGTAVTAIGTPATSEQSADFAHSDTNSWKIVTDAANEGFQRDVVTTSGKYYLVAGWVYDATAGKTVTMTVTHALLQYSAAANTRVTTAVGAWTRLFGVFRATAATIHVQFTATDATTFYVDDVSVITMDDVSLTVTPASAANSVESGGIRVDGLDLCTQPIPAGRLFATQGWIRFRCIPRHNDADAAKFGFAQPQLAYIWGDANNAIELFWGAANLLTLGRTASGVWAAQAWAPGGAIVPGGNYLMEIRYSPTDMQLFVDGVLRITVAAATLFAVVPTLCYIGTWYATAQNDAVYLAP